MAKVLRLLLRALRPAKRKRVGLDSARSHPVKSEHRPGAVGRPETRAPAAFDPVTSKSSLESRAITGRAYVTDGDTIIIRKTQIRLFGIDAPELDHPFGNKAKWAMVGLCKGQIIRAEIKAEDHFGRTVAKCFLTDGRDLSAELVRLGLALDWPKYSDGLYGPLEVAGIRKKLWLADARQKGRMHVWEQFEHRKLAKSRA